MPIIKERSTRRTSSARGSRASQLMSSASLPSQSRTNKEKLQSKRRPQSFPMKKSWRRPPTLKKADSKAPKTHRAKAALRTRPRLLNTP
jgi:hypothetical protein